MSAPTANSANVWVNCQASPQLSAAYPDLEPDAPHRVEGREWHTVAEKMLRDGEVTGTADQQEGAELFALALRDFAPVDAWHVEERLDLSSVSAHLPPGRPDAWAFHDGWLRVADYKAGHGYVSEFDHWQCLIYLAGLLRKLQADGAIADTPEAEEHLRVSVTIVQPRYFGRHGKVRTWKGRASDLRTTVNVVAHAAALAMSEKPPARVGPWCTKCEGRRGCGLLQEAAGGIAEWAESLRVVAPQPHAVGVELTHIRAAIKLLEARADGLDAQALHFLQRGDTVPGFEMGAVQTRETWQPGVAEQVLALGDLLGVDLRQPAAPVTPAQARKKGVDEGVINQYAHRPAGARKLMQTDPDTTKRIFSNGE